MGFEILGCCGDNDFVGWGNQTLRLRLSGPPAHLHLVRCSSLQREGPQRVPAIEALNLWLWLILGVATSPEPIWLARWPQLIWRPCPHSHLACSRRRGKGGAWSEGDAPWEGAPPLLVLQAASGSWCEVVPLSSPGPLCDYFRGASALGRLGPTRIGGCPPWGRGPLISTLFLT